MDYVRMTERKIKKKKRKTLPVPAPKVHLTQWVGRETTTGHSKLCASCLASGSGDDRSWLGKPWCGAASEGCRIR